jgi:hypothetical protein
MPLSFKDPKIRFMMALNPFENIMKAYTLGPNLLPNVFIIGRGKIENIPEFTK